MIIKAGNGYIDGKVEIGTKIKFFNEKQCFTVRASNNFISILTKPFNAKKTVIYTIVDWRGNRRGPEDLIFGMGAETDEQCEAMLDRITNGNSDISKRHGVDMVGKYAVEWIKFPSRKKLKEPHSVRASS